MARVLLPVGLLVVFGIGIVWGVIYYHFDPWYQPASQSSIDLPQDQSVTISCFVSDFDCRQLERVELNGRFIGYGLKLTSPAKLLSPLTGATTTGQLSFAPSAGAYRYPTLSIHPKGFNDPTRLEYVFPQSIEFTVRPVAPGDTLLMLEPVSAPMPPFGDYDLLIQAFDAQAQIVDPLIYLP